MWDNLTLPTIFDIIDRYGLPLVGLVVLIVWLRPKMDEVWRKMMGLGPKENESVQKLLKADVEINGLLQEALIRFAGHWATVWQFHNGSMSMAGVPFLKLSATHEMTDNLHGAVAYLFQNMSTSLFSDNTMLMYQKRVVLLDTNDLALNSAVRNAMLTYKIVRSYMAGINDSRGCLVGAFTVSYDDHHDLTLAQQDLIAEYADRAGMLLELSARQNKLKDIEGR